MEFVQFVLTTWSTMEIEDVDAQEEKSSRVQFVSVNVKLMS